MFDLGAHEYWEFAKKHATQVQAVARTLTMSPQWVINEAMDADPTSNKIYMGWILKQMKFRNIRFPEDRHRVRELLLELEEAKRVKPPGVILDINRYPKISDLSQAMDAMLEMYSGRETERPRTLEDLPEGARVHAESENYQILEVTHPNTCIYLARGTKWCTKEMQNADQYIERYGKLYVILMRHGDRWVVHGQYTPDYQQIMDTRDQGLVIDNEELTNLMGPDLNAPDGAYKAILYAKALLINRWPLAESVILEDPHAAYLYAKDVIRGRWPEGEPIIASSPDYSYLYAKEIIKGPWPPGERVIAEDGPTSYEYAHQILHDRFPEGESALARIPSYATAYASHVIHGRFHEAEPFIAQDPEWAVTYAKNVLHRRFHEGEAAIASSPKYAYDYMNQVLREPWPMGEAAIGQDPDTAVAYARDVLGGPFPEGEAAIATDAKRSYMYARDVLHDRFPAGEPAIAKEPQWVFFYARDVIRGRWPEGEAIIYKNKWWTKEYEELFQ